MLDTALWFVLLLTPPFGQAEEFDIVLSGGRVLDPESGLDAVRDVGIRGTEIASVSELSLSGRARVDVSGLLVVPGFIDLHAHGQSYRANQFQAKDGVTTALELESGYPGIGAFLDSRRGRALINYGASVSHGMVRTLAMPRYESRADEAERASSGEEPLFGLQQILREGFYDPLPEERAEALHALFDEGLREGALGIGMPHQYYPGADRQEIFRVFEFATDRDVPIFTHVRSMGADAIQEVVADAAATGASVHIVHVNSSSLGDLPLVLRIIGGAQEHGVDVTTEAYPYTAASTSLESSIFDDGWQERLGISYRDLQWQDTGERLTEDTFRKYRSAGGVVIIHMMKQEWIDLAVRTPFVMIASDGMPYARGAHPRSAGTFSRVLGQYVREREVLDVMEAIGKMTILPARRLETMAPAMKNKGRIREGADADVTVFDLERIRDTSTFEEDLSYSRGVVQVLVNGTFVVRDGELVEGVYPGEPILGRLAAR